MLKMLVCNVKVSTDSYVMIIGCCENIHIRSMAIALERARSKAEFYFVTFVRVLLFLNTTVSQINPVRNGIIILNGTVKCTYILCEM